MLTLIGTLVLSVANATYVQWIRCPDGNGGTQDFDNLWPRATRASLVLSTDSSESGQSGARLEFGVLDDYVGNATCAELLNGGPPNMIVTIDALKLSETYVVSPSNWTCLSEEDRPAWEPWDLM
jgi:hypothetical protein